MYVYIYIYTHTQTHTHTQSDKMSNMILKTDDFELQRHKQH